MKAVIIAAGQGRRLRPLTDHTPKCLVDMGGFCLLDRTVEMLHAIGCRDLAIVTGYKAEQIKVKGATYFHNAAYRDNNVLHSFLCARAFLDEDVMVSYSDTIFERAVAEKLLKTNAPIALAVDTAWEVNYRGRTDNPVEDGEHVLYTAHGRVVKVGKFINPKDYPGMPSGEFMGLFKVTRPAIAKFLSHFDALDATLSGADRFQRAETWRQAYVSDFFQELIDHGEHLVVSENAGGWAEIDTMQDYERFRLREAWGGSALL